VTEPNLSYHYLEQRPKQQPEHSIILAAGLSVRHYSHFPFFIFPNAITNKLKDDDKSASISIDRVAPYKQPAHSPLSEINHGSIQK
jgi:hypothetical protein